MESSHSSGWQFLTQPCRHNFPFDIVVAKKEFLELAEDIRPHTARSMKMEPAPWIRDYLVDMEELYTELTFEKVDGRLFQQEHILLENYKELFAWHNPGMLEYFNIMYYLPDWHPTRKILIKGPPGILELVRPV